MTPKKCDIVIIGAGLTGLALAYFLKDKQTSITILEARNRIGGRIETLRHSDAAPMEMGATWLGQQHASLLGLLKELDLGIFEQQLGKTAIYEAISTSPPQIVQLPPNNVPSYRIKNGTDSIIQALATAIENSCTIQLQQPVTTIEEQGENLLAITTTATFIASKVISTLPPNLLLSNVAISPDLPNKVKEVMELTHTWMGESIKIGLHFKEPFWRKDNLSGTIMSNVGPIPEMYDHSNFEDQQFALKGFLNGNYFSLTKEERLALILKQLRKYYGNQVDQYIRYDEQVWRNEPYTFTPYTSHVLPHQHNGHAIYQQPYLSGKLFLAGAETATAFPGYMDGAIRSAKSVANQLFKQYT